MLLLFCSVRSWLRIRLSWRRGVLSLSILLSWSVLDKSGARGAEAASSCRYKFLVIDDRHLLETHNLQRRVNAATKHPEPVLTLDAPWHPKNEMLNFVNVLYDEEEQLFKMWYCTMRWPAERAYWDGGRKFAYATSKDGIHWEKPILRLVEINGSRENNYITPEMDQAFVCTIIQDPSDVLTRRYKMIFSTGGGDGDWAQFHIPLSLAYSQDGLVWERPRHVNPVLRGVSDIPWGFFYDPDRRKYVLLTRRVPNTPRDVSQYESYDLVNWKDRGRVLVPGDEHDPKTVRTNAYYMAPFRYEDIYLGALNVLYAHPVSEAYGSHHKSEGYPEDKMGQEEVQLAYSRDGESWHRPADRSPIVPIGKPGDPDQGAIYVGLHPVVVRGETWIYYTALKWSHNWWDWMGHHDPEQGVREVASCMLARMPEDHWVSLDAGESEGWLLSKPWGPPQEIFVNADAEGGLIEVELVTPFGDAIEGFRRSDSIPIRSNGKNQSVRWKGDPSPSQLQRAHRGGISARFYLRQAKLYSYTLTLPDPDGRLSRQKRDARWLETIKHRSDNWGGMSTDPAAGPPPQVH